MNTTQMLLQINGICPVYSVSFEDPSNSQTWVITTRPEATKEQLAALDTFLATNPTCINQ